MSASHLATPAYWASWADALPVLDRQAPQVTTTILDPFEQPATAPPHIQAAHAARQKIFEHGWEPPSWQQLTVQQPPPARDQIFAGPTQPGWQQHAAAPINIAAREGIYSSLDPASQAMLDSQTSPFGSRTFTTIPCTAKVTYPHQIFRVLMLRRLRLPLPLTERTCRCCRALDPLGDHRAACARARVFRSRRVPLEPATARVCREAGARVTMHTRWNQLNIPAVNHSYSFIFIFIHSYSFIHIHSFTFVHSHSFTFIHSHSFIHIHSFTFIHSYSFIHIHSFIFIHSYSFIFIHSFSFIHSHSLIFIHSFSFIHFHSFILIHSFSFIFIHSFFFSTRLFDRRKSSARLCLYWPVSRCAWAADCFYTGQSPDMQNPLMYGGGGEKAGGGVAVGVLCEQVT